MLVKEKFASKMDAQVSQIEALFTVVEMDAQGLQAGIAKLAAECSRRNEQLKDWERRCLKTLFKFDIGERSNSHILNCILTSKPDAVLDEKNSVTLTNFLDHAWKRKLRVVNWPVGAQFPKFDGCKDTKSMPMDHVRMILKPRKAELDYAYAGQSSETNQNKPNEVAYCVELWPDGTLIIFNSFIIVTIMLSLQLKRMRTTRPTYHLWWISTVMLLSEFVM